ncbi:MAG TPA: cytochrome P450 [Solirubrobacterales bacterium]|nr:cytochrome P450 [Solirubrobacterales bacterium]
MSAKAANVADIRLADIDFYADGTPHWAFRQLREEAPISWQEGFGFPGHWAVVKHDHAVQISKDPATFSSEQGITVESLESFGDSELVRRGTNMMVYIDPPRHNRIRALVNRDFTPRRVAQYEDFLRGVVGELFDTVTTEGESDFVADIAAPLPMFVICELLGVPRDDRQYLIGLFNRFFGVDDPEFQEEGLTVEENTAKVYEEINDYLEKNLLRQKRQLAAGDIGSMLAGAEIDGDRLSDDEIVAFYHLLLGAGSETTRTAASGGLQALFENPEQLDLLREDPALIPSAVEEILRWVSPILGFGRVATKDTEVHGQAIAAGDKIHMWYVSANRDEDVFADSEVFDVRRSPNPHLSFGVGTHFCLGSSLARLELRVLFELLLERFAGIESAGEVEYLRTLLTPGIKHMPIRLRRA